MDVEQGARLKSVIENLAVFRWLTIPQAARILKLCEQRRYRVGMTVYEEGSASEEMLILLSGHLRAINCSGTVLGEIHPGDTTGEMSLLTGRITRVATVIALENSHGFTIGRSELWAVLKSNDALRIKVLENMVDVLCQKIEGANHQVETYAKK
jgi:CRP-like cAMP-binding protein